MPFSILKYQNKNIFMQVLLILNLEYHFAMRRMFMNVPGIKMNVYEWLRMILNVHKRSWMKLSRRFVNIVNEQERREVMNNRYCIFYRFQEVRILMVIDSNIFINTLNPWILARSKYELTHYFLEIFVDQRIAKTLALLYILQHLIVVHT